MSIPQTCSKLVFLQVGMQVLLLWLMKPSDRAIAHARYRSDGMEGMLVEISAIDRFLFVLKAILSSNKIITFVQTPRQ